MEGINGVISGYARYDGKLIEDMHVVLNRDYLFFLLCYLFFAAFTYRYFIVLLLQQTRG